MDLRYEKLFSVDFIHHYHQTNRFDGFEVVPDGQTVKLMSAYGLRMKRVTGGFIVLYTESDNRPTLLRSLSEKIRLNFHLVANDPLLWNYSDIIPDQINKTYYLTNTDDEGNHKQSLHVGDLAMENDRINSISAVSDLLNFVDTIPETIMVQNQAKEILFEGRWDEFSSNRDSIEDVMSAGYISVDFDSKGEAKNFYFATSAKPLFGIINIWVAPEDDNLSFDIVKNTTYTFSLGARSVIWRYNLINDGRNSYTDFKVMDGNEQLPTHGPAEVVLANGSKAYQIESSSAIVLKERYEKYYELEMVKGGVAAINQTIKKRMNLPAPDVGRIKMSKTDDSYMAYGEMYIYF